MENTTEKEIGKIIYKQLVEATNNLPKDAVEKAPKNITRKGYDTTGYGYQFLVNVLNETLGIGGWGFKYELLKEIEGKWSNEKSYWDITVNVTVWIKVDNSTPASFSCVGGHKSEMYSDALKGAITNGFKKTVAFFGVGKNAYEGTIDEDYRPPTYKHGEIDTDNPKKYVCADCSKNISKEEFNFSTDVKQRERFKNKSLCVLCQKNYPKEVKI